MKSINDRRDLEVYFQRIPYEVIDSWSPEQLSAVCEALNLSIAKPSPKMVDLRFEIDLIFRKFYCVILMGRDFRTRRRQIHHDKRTRLGNIVTTILILLLLNLAVSMLILLVLYFIKSGLGINIFREKHAYDLFWEWIS